VTILADAKPSVPARYRADRRGEQLRLELEGDWVTAQAGTLDRALNGLSFNSVRQVEIDGSRIGRMDSVGAWLLLRLRYQAEQGGGTIGAFSAPGNFAALREAMHRDYSGPPERPPRPPGILRFLNETGAAAIEILRTGYAMLGYLGLVTVESAQTIAHRRMLRLIPMLNQIQETGISALPILGLLALLLGIVIAYQGVDQLRKFGAEIFTVNLLGASMLREIGVLITAIIVAGRSGSAFTAHIGTMKLNQEIDALETSGFNVAEVLVMPRVIALVIVLPLLTFYADLMGLIGGAVMCYFDLGITFPAFVHQLHDAIGASTFWVGIVKAPIFAFIIALVGCFEGMRVEGNAASVGHLTTRSVVESIFLVIVFDAGFSILFSILDV